jgi:hypothetical protein
VNANPPASVQSDVKVHSLVLATVCLGTLGQHGARAAEATSAESAWADESARYRVTYGLLGKVAELTILYQVPNAKPGQRSPQQIHATASGSGAILGFGETARDCESDFDLAAKLPLRWTSSRREDGKTTIHTAEQAQSGAIALREHQNGKDDRNQSFNRPTHVDDPLSFLLRLRMALPRAPASYEVLDGKALWRVDIASVQPDRGSPSVIRIDGKLEPIDWGGANDKLRSSQAFTLFLSNDRFHTPLRALFPMGLGKVEVQIVALQSLDMERRLRLVRQVARIVRGKRAAQ